MHIPGLLSPRKDMRDAENLRAWLGERKRKIQDHVNAAKNCPCNDCGGQYESFLMELDHVRGEKSLSVANAWKRNWSITRLDSEIALCEVVCIGCHRLRTRDRGQCAESKPKPRVLTGEGWTCVRCGITKDKGLFAFSHGRIVRCLNCESDRTIRRKRSMKLTINELKHYPCVDCQQNFDPILMDFHHIDSRAKAFSVGAAIHDGINFIAILEEIKKCVLLCCWCHGRRDHRAKSA